MLRADRGGRSLALIAVAVLLVLLVGACGGDDDESSDAQNVNTSVNAENWSLAEAAKPYAGTEIRVLDEISDLQPAMAELVPEFEKETGIKVSYELEPHPDVIRKGEADVISGRGAYDAVMVHVQQAGRVLAADAIEPIDQFYDNPALHDPEVNWDDFIQPLTDESTVFNGEHIAFPNWNYNLIWWGRRDLMEHPDEKAAFEKEYGRELAVPETLQEVRDFAEFFNRKDGERLAGETVDGDFAGIVIEGAQAGSAVELVDRPFMAQFGGGIFDEEGVPAADRPENAEAMKLYGEIFEQGPAGQAEMSLIDVPIVMGEGRAASGYIWSDFAFNIDKKGESPHAGDFVYAPSQINADNPDEHITAVQPGMIMMSRASENKEATYLFMQWLVSPQTQDKWLDGGVAIPVRADDIDHPTITDGPRAQFFEAVMENLQNGVPWDKGPSLYEAFDAVNRMAQQVGQGDATPEEALSELQGELQEICGDSCFLE